MGVILNMYTILTALFQEGSLSLASLYLGGTLAFGIAIAIGFRRLANTLEIAAGYNAKIMASCVFVNGREASHVEKEELQRFYYVKTVVDHERGVVTSTACGIVKRRAIFEGIKGCRLLDKDEPIPSNSTQHHNMKAASSNRAEWPLGNPPMEVVFEKRFKQPVDSIFIESDPKLQKRTRAVVISTSKDILFEKYATGFSENDRMAGWSIAKGVTSILTGILVDQGLLDLDQTTGVRSWQNDQRKDITLRHLLNMTSGLEFEEDYSKPSDVTRMLFSEVNPAAYAMSKKSIYTPGSDWSYASGSTNIVGKIICDHLPRQYRSVQDFARKALFTPLGMDSAVLEASKDNGFVGSSHIHATARDWARFGVMLLNNGEFNNQRIVSEKWMDFVKTPVSGSPNDNYGGHFWLNIGPNRQWQDLPDDIFYCAGFQGQRIFIIPSYDLVVVRLGQADNAEAWDKRLFLKEILDQCQPVTDRSETVLARSMA